MDERKIERLILWYRKFGDVLRTINEINKLDSARGANLRALQARTQKIVTMCEELNDNTIVREFIFEISAFQQQLIQSEQSFVDEFGVRLEELLQARRIILTGQYPNLRAGLFTIRMDLKNWQVTLWYGPEQERLEKCTLDAETVTSRISTKLDTLGTQLDLKQYVEIISNAFNKLRSKPGSNETVPIIQLFSEMVQTLHDNALLQDPGKIIHLPYSRADFSFDLFKLKRYSQGDLPILVHLTVATRAHTADKSKYLWIPDDLKGNGSTYSHISIREA